MCRRPVYNVRCDDDDYDCCGIFGILGNVSPTDKDYDFVLFIGETSAILREILKQFQFIQKREFPGNLKSFA